jgi:uncharacterized protein (DUF362 family)
MMGHKEVAMNRRMTRREALGALGAAGLAAMSGPLVRRIAAAEPLDVVKVSGGDSPARLVEGALKALGGMERFVSRGSVVVVKPNIGWDRLPEQAANTNPEVVAATVRACLQAGASRVRVFDRTCNDPRRTYTHSGIAEAARKAGAEVLHIDERLFRTVPINGRHLKEWPLYKLALECDVLINVPIAKHHSLAGRTLSLKNWMGVIGGDRGFYHHDLDESLLDLATVLKPRLSIVDAYRILLNGGPQGGNLDQVKTTRTIIAGVDQIAVDAWACTLFPGRPVRPKYLDLAPQRGLGQPDYMRLRHAELTLG